jgi:hypothetical protein
MALNGPWAVNVHYKIATNGNMHYNITTSGGKNRFHIIVIRLERLGTGLYTRGTVILLAGTAEFCHRCSFHRGCGAHQARL